MKDELRQQLYKGRAKCPSCGKKGVGFANHAHATGHKDFSRFSCRYCHKVFREKKHEDTPKAGGQ